MGGDSTGEFLIGRCNKNADGLPEWQWTLNIDLDMAGPFNFANVSLPSCGKYKSFQDKVPVICLYYAMSKQKLLKKTPINNKREIRFTVKIKRFGTREMCFHYHKREPTVTLVVKD